MSIVIAELKNASKHYGSIQALKNINLQINSGQVLALLGPNGAGKTTAISLLLGLIQPSSGAVELFGGNPKRPEARMRVGVMLQISGVPETLKVKEHLDLFRSYYPHPLSLPEVLEFSGLAGLENRLYSKLSGGQRQRLHLALALCGNPDLLFLDEPTTGLDIASRRALWEQIRHFTRLGKAVVLTTHYLEEADALADRVVVINQGSIVAEGTPAAIKAQTAGQKIRAVTNLNISSIRHLPGVSHVYLDGAATEILTSKAEPIVYYLLQHDPDLSGLEVSSTALEDAFLVLTQKDHQKSEALSA
jgi:ABC-2 type transport system ATP-binding protein